MWRDFARCYWEKNFVNPGMSPDTLIPGDDFSAGLSG
jgi:hypothetical protein